MNQYSNYLWNINVICNRKSRLKMKYGLDLYKHKYKLYRVRLRNLIIDIIISSGWTNITAMFCRCSILHCFISLYMYMYLFLHNVEYLGQFMFKV